MSWLPVGGTALDQVHEWPDGAEVVSWSEHVFACADDCAVGLFVECGDAWHCFAIGCSVSHGFCESRVLSGDAGVVLASFFGEVCDGLWVVV